MVVVYTINLKFSENGKNESLVKLKTELILMSPQPASCETDKGKGAKLARLINQAHKPGYRPTTLLLLYVLGSTSELNKTYSIIFSSLGSSEQSFTTYFAFGG